MPTRFCEWKRAIIDSLEITGINWTVLGMPGCGDLPTWWFYANLIIKLDNGEHCFGGQKWNQWVEVPEDTSELNRRKNCQTGIIVQNEKDCPIITSVSGQARRSLARALVERISKLWGKVGQTFSKPWTHVHTYRQEFQENTFILITQIFTYNASCYNITCSLIKQTFTSSIYCFRWLF